MATRTTIIIFLFCSFGVYTKGYASSSRWWFWDRMESTCNSTTVCQENYKCQSVFNSEKNITMCMYDGNCKADKQCPDYLRCVSKPKKCGFCRVEGEDCFFAGDNECCSGYCHPYPLGYKIAGTCVVIRAQECNEHNDCDNDFHCHEHWCEPCKRAKTPCRRNDDCCSGSCKNNKKISYLATCQ